MLTIAPESAADTPEVEQLLDLSFAPGRTALSSYRLRDGVAPVAGLCLVARDEYGVIVGAIRYWPVLIDGRWRALLLGPVAVHPTRQGEGIAALLILDSLELARAQGWERAVLVGDEPYYRRFGFRRALALGLEFPEPTNPNRVLAKELCEGAMADIAGPVEKAAG
ncbi:MAG: N-acetyltransferase [Neomegalonema sp.]|nr:N-acetyltransferase [Neomegalonema sp.]